MTLTENVTRRAVELAKSGRHRDCISIEAELDRDGFPEVYVVLDQPELRASVKALCQLHWHAPETKLEMAARHIRLGREHITRQIEIIERFKAKRLSTELAERVLANFEDMQRLHQAHLERLQ